jgi:hypothetical protein
MSEWKVVMVMADKSEVDLEDGQFDCIDTAKMAADLELEMDQSAASDDRLGYIGYRIIERQTQSPSSS